LGKNLIHTLPQSPYSPDFSPPDFFLFPKLKITLKGRRLQTIEDMTTNVKSELKEIPQTSLEHCFQKWKRLWERDNIQ
jgi:histone-lysine N-methyltransferase SETMAR